MDFNYNRLYFDVTSTNNYDTAIIPDQFIISENKSKKIEKYIDEIEEKIEEIEEKITGITNLIIKIKRKLYE